MPIETLAAAFASYRRTVLPGDASDVQITETRRAFVAGAYWMLLHVADVSADQTEDQAVATLDRLKAECEAFGAGGGLAPLEAPATEPAAQELDAMAPPLWHQSGVNQQGEPFVQLLLGERPIAQMDVHQARDHAAAILEAAEASEQDAFLMLFFRTEFDLKLEAAAQILIRFRTVRAERTEKHGGPTTMRDWVRPPATDRPKGDRP